MLIDIIQMPMVIGDAPFRQRTLIGKDQSTFGTTEPHIHWPSIPFNCQLKNLAPYTSIVPKNLFKAIYAGGNTPYVFEVVFCVHEKIQICLYVKILTPCDVTFGLSMNGIKFHHSVYNRIIPLSQFLDQRVYFGDAAIQETIVPPLFTETDLWRNLRWIGDLVQSDPQQLHLGWCFKPIYTHIPHIFQALVDGEYRSHPLGEQRWYHPGIQVTADRWFNHQEMTYASQAMNFRSQVNHPDMDDVIMRILYMTVPKFKVTALMSHALDQLNFNWLCKDYHDPYHSYLRGVEIDTLQWKNNLETVFHQAASLHCSFTHTPPEQFLNTLKDKSSITISKNMFDEVLILVTDEINNVNISYYSYLPALAIGTLSVGSL